MKKYIIPFLVLVFSLTGMNVQAQKERGEIREGNDKYENGKYSDAETSYRKALEKNSSSYPGNYNLGGSLYRQKKFDEAIQQYEHSSAKTTDPREKSQTYHNLGNSYFEAQKYDESIKAYKEALKLNPSDQDTRYNLAYAQTMLKKQQEQQNKENKDSNKDQQKKDQQQEQKENQDKNKQDQQKQDPKKEQARQQQPKISKEDAERILQALKNDEQNLQEKLAKKEGQRINIDKNW